MNKLEFLECINKISFESIEQAKQYEFSKDIHWFANETPEGIDVKFNGVDITDYYANNEYGKRTRWDLWNSCINCIKSNEDIKSLLDIGGANGHFTFLCLKNNIDAYSIDPRICVLKSTEKEFISNFNEKKSYCGNIKIFLDVLESNINKIDFTFDCITILNFLHGNGHKLSDIQRMVNLFPKISKYILVSEPNWSTLGSENLFKNLTFLQHVGYDNLHKLYKINK